MRPLGSNEMAMASEISGSEAASSARNPGGRLKVAISSSGESGGRFLPQAISSRRENVRIEIRVRDSRIVLSVVHRHSCLCGFCYPGTQNHTGRNACTTKSLFLRALQRFFASVGQTIGFRRPPCHGQKPKTTTV